MALDKEIVEFIKTHGNVGAHALALHLDIKYSTVVNIAHRHRISLKINGRGNGRSMQKHVLQTPETTEILCRNTPVIEAIRHEMWLKTDYMGKQVLGTAQWKKQRLRVLQRDAYICAYCGQEATEVDHVVPRSKGGGHDLDNLVACCKPCNGRKSNIEEGRFLDTLSAPPAFPDNTSPTQSKPMLDSPFVARPDPIN